MYVFAYTLELQDILLTSNNTEVTNTAPTQAEVKYEADSVKIQHNWRKDLFSTRTTKKKPKKMQGEEEADDALCCCCYCCAAAVLFCFVCLPGLLPSAPSPPSPPTQSTLTILVVLHAQHSVSGDLSIWRQVTSHNLGVSLILLTISSKKVPSLATLFAFIEQHSR